MLCKKPIAVRGALFGCGQCLPCRINKRRQWMWRQFFESLSHEENCFVTLTYDDLCLPAGNTLVPSHMRDFLKRFRERLSPAKVRFFGVGEYGSDGKRGVNPHYHISMFGVSGTTLYVGKQIIHQGCSQLVSDSWGMGNVYCAEFNEKTAQYVAGYTTKKLTSPDDPRLGGRHPEFMRSSRRPGLGADAMAIVAKQLLDTVGLVDGDVPSSLRLGRKPIPLGRYLLGKARLAAGMTDADIQKAKERNSLTDGRYARSVELRDLLLSSIETDPTSTLTKVHARDVAQRVLQAEARYKLWSEKKESL